MRTLPAIRLEDELPLSPPDPPERPPERRAAPGVTTMEETGEEVEPALPYYVILYNDDFHGIDEVVLQVQKAAGVSLQDAFEITMEAHTRGKAVCYTGDAEECEKVAAVLREIKLTVEIDHYAGR